MADFIAVIRRAVDGLSNNTPEMRAKVYDKARSAVLRQLENMNPRPPEQMLQRQLDKLNAAIIEVEAEHAEVLPDEEAAAAFEDAMAVPAVEEELREQAPAVAQVTAAEPERHAATAPGDWAAEAAPEDWAAEETPAERDHWVAPAESEGQAEAQPRVEAEAEKPSAEESDVTPQPVAVVAHEEPLQWAEEPVETADEQAATFPAYADVDRYAVPGVEPEEFYAEPAAGEEPEEHQESVRAAEAEAEVLEAETAAGAGVVEPGPIAPAYNRLVEIPLTSEDDWAAKPTADAGADQELAAAPEAAEPAAYEAWEIPAEAPRWPEEPVQPTAATGNYAAAAEAAPPAQSGPAVPGALDIPDWDGTTYGQPAIVEADGQSRDMPVASDDFSDWFAEYDKPKAAAVDEAEVADAPVEGTVAPPRAGEPGEAVAAKGAEDVDSFLADSQQRAYRIEPTQGRNYAPVVLGLLGIALVGAGGFAAWNYRDQITQFVSGSTATPPTAVTEGTAPEAGTVTETAAGQQTPAGAPANGALDDGSVAGEKFTQRLMPDGTEVDEGAGATAAGGPATEGKSVAEQNVASTGQPTDQPAVGTNAGGAQTASPPALSDSVAPAANGERVFLYEERLGQTSPTAVPGTVAWTALRETGGDGKPNPEIQGRITIPDRGLTALMTIKRNTDSSLPASHLIEVVFSVPPDFEGGAVDKLERIAMKRTEQDRGDPLVAVSAKVTDDTYLVALNDFEDVMKANLDLLATRGWIDIPISYRNGRRALLTLDKGAAGAAVFDQVMKEWTALGPPAN